MRNILGAVAIVITMAIGLAWAAGNERVTKVGNLFAAERQALQTIRFKVFTVFDDQLRLPAIQMLVPAGWEGQGRVIWRSHPQYPVAIMARIYNPNGREELNILPDVPYADGVFFPKAAITWAMKCGG